MSYSSFSRGRGRFAILWWKNVLGSVAIRCVSIAVPMWCPPDSRTPLWCGITCIPMGAISPTLGCRRVLTVGLALSCTFIMAPSCSARCCPNCIKTKWFLTTKNIIGNKKKRKARITISITDIVIKLLPLQHPAPWRACFNTWQYHLG